MTRQEHRARGRIRYTNNTAFRNASETEKHVSRSSFVVLSLVSTTPTSQDALCAGARHCTGCASVGGRYALRAMSSNRAVTAVLVAACLSNDTSDQCVCDGTFVNCGFLGSTGLPISRPIGTRTLYGQLVVC